MFIISSDLESVFREYGQIESIEMARDYEASKNAGYAFVQYKYAYLIHCLLLSHHFVLTYLRREPDGAKRALVALNGKVMAGQPLKVGLVSADSRRHVPDSGGVLDNVNEDTETGMSMNPHARLALMAKLQVRRAVSSVLFLLFFISPSFGPCRRMES